MSSQDPFHLGRVSFDGSDLRRAVFANAVLSGTTFTNADLRDTDFSDAYLGEYCWSTRLPLSLTHHRRSVRLEEPLSQPHAGRHQPGDQQGHPGERWLSVAGYDIVNHVRLKRFPFLFVFFLSLQVFRRPLPPLGPLTAAVVVLPEQRRVVDLHVAAVVELLAAAGGGPRLELAA